MFFTLSIVAKYWYYAEFGCVLMDNNSTPLDHHKNLN